MTPQITVLVTLDIEGSSVRNIHAMVCYLMKQMSVVDMELVSLQMFVIVERDGRVNNVKKQFVLVKVVNRKEFVPVEEHVWK